MDLDTIKQRLPDYAKDLKLNLSSVLSGRGSPGLSAEQRAGIALASAFGGRNPGLARDLELAAGEVLSPETRRAARAAAAIMGMNNVYYRFVHEMGRGYRDMPARLRMNVVGSPGVAKVDFELMSLAVSAVNGCGLCMRSHEDALRAAGLGPEAIQSAVRIASTVHAIALVEAWAEEADAA